MSNIDERIFMIMLEKFNTKLSQLDDRLDAIERIMSHREQEATTPLLPDPVEEFKHVTIYTGSAFNDAPEAVCLNSLRENNCADTLEYNSDMVYNMDAIVESIDTTIACSKGLPVIAQQSLSLCFGLCHQLYQCNKYITVNTLTCDGEFAPEAPPGLTACGSHNKVWDPGLRFA